MGAVGPLASRRRRAVGLVCALALGSAGCGLFGPSDPLDEERDRLQQARAQWRSQGFTSYEYTFQRNCFCAFIGPATVLVRGGAVVAVTRVEDGAPLDPANYFTVEGLFDFLQDALDDDPAEYQAAYDPALGYPTSAFVDFEEMVADEEQGFAASDLRPLRP